MSPSQSRVSPLASGYHSRSTPNLPTLRSLERTEADKSTTPVSAVPFQDHSPRSADSGLLSPSSADSPSEPASISDDFALDDAAIPDIDSGSSSSDDSQSPRQQKESNRGESDNASDNTPIGNLPARPLSSSFTLPAHSRSYTHLAPPFYNRPPTPLPPSPSLTSLLRPNFSATTSRPTTPDPSSDEGASSRGLGLGVSGTQTPNTAAAASTLTSSFRTARPIPRASPKVPTYEYYGFTLYLTSSLVFLMYLLWSFLPSPLLHQLHIYYYPNRWWSLAIPAWLVMLVLYIYIALAGYNTGYLTLGMTEIECLVDEAADIAVIDKKGRIMRQGWRDRGVANTHRGHTDDEGGRNTGRGRHGKRSRTANMVERPRGGGLAPLTKSKETHHTETDEDTNGEQELHWKTLWNEGTDAVMDVPIGGVCEVLYGQDDAEHWSDFE